MLYRHEKPCFKRKQTRVEPSFPKTILHIQCFPFWRFASTTQMYSQLCEPNFKLSHSFSYFQVFHVCQLKTCLWAFIPWVYHGILDLLKDPSFYSCSLSPSVQLSKNHEGRNWSFIIMWINLFKTEDYRELLKIVEDRCDPSLFSYLGISGSRFL
jgi:hypothetical protein